SEYRCHEVEAASAACTRILAVLAISLIVRLIVWLFTVLVVVVMIWVGRPRRQLGALRMMLALILIAGGLQGGLIGVPTVVLRGEILVVPGPRRISVGGELLDFVVRRRVTARRRLVRFTAHCIARWRSTRLTAHRHSLADKPRQFGQRIVSLAAAQAFGVLPGRQISMPTRIAISHDLPPA